MKEMSEKRRERMKANKEKETYSTFEEYRSRFYPKIQSKTLSKGTQHYELGVSLARESLSKLRDLQQE